MVNLCYACYRVHRGEYKLMSVCHRYCWPARPLTSCVRYVKIAALSEVAKPCELPKQVKVCGPIFDIVCLMMSHCFLRTLRVAGHSVTGWGIVGFVWLQTAGSKVRSFGQWATATCAAPPMSLPVSTPLRIVNRCWSGFPCKWRYINVATFNLIVSTCTVQ